MKNLTLLLRVANSLYFWGQNDVTFCCTIFGGQNDCNLLLYLTTKYVLNISRGQLPGCPLLVGGLLLRLFSTSKIFCVWLNAASNMNVFRQMLDGCIATLTWTQCLAYLEVINTSTRNANLQRFNFSANVLILALLLFLFLLCSYQKNKSLPRLEGSVKEKSGSI